MGFFGLFGERKAGPPSNEFDANGNKIEAGSVQPADPIADLEQIRATREAAEAEGQQARMAMLDQKAQEAPTLGGFSQVEQEAALAQTAVPHVEENVSSEVVADVANQLGGVSGEGVTVVAEAEAGGQAATGDIELVGTPDVQLGGDVKLPEVPGEAKVEASDKSAA